MSLVNYLFDGGSFSTSPVPVPVKDLFLSQCSTVIGYESQRPLLTELELILIPVTWCRRYSVKNVRTNEKVLLLIERENKS